MNFNVSTSTPRTSARVATFVVFLSYSSTSLPYEVNNQDLKFAIDVTSSGQVQLKTALDFLNDIQKHSKLTLEQIAKLIKVSRRTVHNWKNGEKIEEVNLQSLQALHTLIIPMKLNSQVACDNFLESRGIAKFTPDPSILETNWNTRGLINQLELKDDIILLPKKGRLVRPYKIKKA